MFRKLLLIFTCVGILALAVLGGCHWPNLTKNTISGSVPETELVQRALQAKGLASLKPVKVIKLAFDASPLPGEETILAINLGKNLAFLAGFDPNGYLIGVSRDLAAIPSITPFTLPGLAEKGILVTEVYDNMVGGFEQTTWHRVFRLDENNVFQQVFAYVKTTEYYWHDAWDKPDGLYWHRVNEDNTFTFPNPEEITVAKKVSRYLALGDPKTMPAEFTLEGTQSETAHFYWNTTTLRFAEGKINP
ncbi:MAG: hypothetical protein PHC60_06585 [Heliobacteriaceae bacterium]|nr:hypothetical protein [Heliobacteriaceae bacterium]MDD4588034.1 hypothetical protein [Heliobacteriaceae bacterium]